MDEFLEVFRILGEGLVPTRTLFDFDGGGEPAGAEVAVHAFKEVICGCSVGG